jgi:hypothetical protein
MKPPDDTVYIYYRPPDLGSAPASKIVFTPTQMFGINECSHKMSRHESEAFLTDYEAVQRILSYLKQLPCECNLLIYVAPELLYLAGNVLVYTALTETQNVLRSLANRLQSIVEFYSGDYEIEIEFEQRLKLKF